jgi:hypothetical protein
MWKMLIKWFQRMRRNWPESKVKEVGEEVRVEENQLFKIGHRNSRKKEGNPIFKWKGEEVTKEDNTLIGTHLLEKEEEEEVEEVK